MRAAGETERLRRLLSAAKAVTEESALEDTLRVLLREALAGVAGRLGWVSVAAAEGLRVLAVEGVEQPAAGSVVPFDRGLTGLAYRTGKPYYAPDVAREPAYWQVTAEVRSEYVAPLTWGGERVGVLNVESTRTDGLSEEDREFISTLAGLAAGVVARALDAQAARRELERKEQDLIRQVRALRALLSAARALASSLDLAHITRVGLERAASVAAPASEPAGAAACHLLLVDKASGELILHTTTALLDGSAEGARMDVARGVTGWVARNRQPLMVADVHRDPRYVPWRAETRSELAVPLLDGNELLGVLNFESNRLRAFDAFDTEIAAAFADLITAAVKNARLYAGLSEARQGLAISEGFRAAGEAAADVIHWVSNKFGGISEALRVIELEAEHLPAASRQRVLGLFALMDAAAAEVLDVKRAVMDAARPVQPEGVAVAALAREAAARYTGGDARILTAGDDEVVAFADRYALVRMLDNALENAMKYAGGEPIVIRWAVREKQMEVEVADRGPGFPEDILRSGLRPRLRAAGTGMGLWLSATFAERMGGRLLLANPPEGGACVRIILPLAEGARR